MLSHEGLVVIKRVRVILWRPSPQAVERFAGCPRIWNLRGGTHRDAHHPGSNSGTSNRPCRLHSDDDESYDRYTDENRNFHHLLAKASGNNELADLSANCTTNWRVHGHAPGGKTMEVTHKRIVDASLPTTPKPPPGFARRHRPGARSHFGQYHGRGFGILAFVIFLST